MVDNGIRLACTPVIRICICSLAKKNEFVFSPTGIAEWNIRKSRRRGYASNEDLYVPGYFEMNIRKG
jgi:hypothetical protein